MVKNILKEVIIILLLCVVITLILGVLFYNYNPIGKVVPSKVAYTTPENIAEELKSTTASTENDISTQNKVYTIDGSDLTLYKKSKAYNPSKENPFATGTEDNEATSTSSVSKVDSSSSNSGSGSGSSSSSSSSSNGNSSSSSSTTNETTTGSTNNQATGTKAKLK